MRMQQAADSMDEQPASARSFPCLEEHSYVGLKLPPGAGPGAIYLHMYDPHLTHRRTRHPLAATPTESWALVQLRDVDRRTSHLLRGATSPPRERQ
jgi:hypothetical protein